MPAKSIINGPTELRFWLFLFAFVASSKVLAQPVAEGQKSLGELMTNWTSANYVSHPDGQAFLFLLPKYEFGQKWSATSLHPSCVIRPQAPKAFFCRLEHQLSMKIQTPFKFRLGSVQYVDWLEGKPASRSFY